MIHWSWALGTLFIGVAVGFLLMGLFAADASEHSWRRGYYEGREEEFQARTKDAPTKKG